jgi:hypothetical protein
MKPKHESSSTKSETILKSLADLPTGTVEAQASKPVEPNAKPPAGVHRSQQVRLDVRGPDNTELTGYRHWGLNE